MRNNHDRRRDHLRDRLQIFHRIIGNLVVEALRHRNVRGLPEHDGVTVRRRLRSNAHTDGAAAARPVVDDHRLTHRLGEILAEHARDEIGTAARRKRHDEADRAFREIVRGGADRRCSCQCNCERRKKTHIPSGNKHHEPLIAFKNAFEPRARRLAATAPTQPGTPSVVPPAITVPRKSASAASSLFMSADTRPRAL